MIQYIQYILCTKPPTKNVKRNVRNFIAMTNMNCQNGDTFYQIFLCKLVMLVYLCMVTSHC